MRKIAKLEIDIGLYMNEGRRLGDIVLELTTKEGIKRYGLNGEEIKVATGEKEVKAYKIGIYEAVLEGIREKEEIDVEAIKSVIKAWQTEKEDYGFSRKEKAQIEEKIAEIILDYQIKKAKESGTIEKKVTQACEETAYIEVIKKSIREIIGKMELKDPNRLGLELLLNSEENIAENNEAWRAILKYKYGIEEEKIKEILEESATREIDQAKTETAKEENILKYEEVKDKVEADVLVKKDAKGDKASTIVDATNNYQILRQGPITEEQIKEIIK